MQLIITPPSLIDIYLFRTCAPQVQLVFHFHKDSCAEKKNYARPTFGEPLLLEPSGKNKSGVTAAN